MDPRASKPGHLLGDALETDSKEIKKSCQIRLTDFLRSILVCRLRAIGFLLSLHYLESSGFHVFCNFASSGLEIRLKDGKRTSSSKGEFAASTTLVEAATDENQPNFDSPATAKELIDFDA